MSAAPLELVNIFLTFDCNLSCSFCASGSHPGRGQHIPFERLEAIADQLRDLAADGDCPAVRLTGGEPAVYPRFLEAVELFAFAPLVNITTNGTRLTASDLEHLSKFPVSLNLSVYADLPDGEVRGAQAIRRVLSGPVPTTVTLVVHRENLSGLGALCAKIESWGARSIILNGVNPAPLVPGPEAVDALVLRHDDVLRLRAFVESRLNRSNCEYVLREPPSASRRAKLDATVPHCRCANGHLSVLPSGAMTPCNSVLGVQVGRRSTPSLTEAYAAPTMAFLRALADLQTEQLEPCRACPDRPSCRAGSRIHAFLRTGDWLAVDPEAACVGRVDRLAFGDPILRRLHEQAVAEQREENPSALRDLVSLRPPR